MVPGHEIVGKVTAVGSAVKKFKVGDTVGVGVTVETCMQCENCLAHAEPYCKKGMVGTYNAKDYEGNLTYGGYANNIVAPEHYVYSISSKLDLAATAPLLCAGHHHLVAAQALERRPRQEGRRRRSRRSRPHGA